MGTGNDNYSFWKLISNCQIEIPQMQRDYAQGRKDNSTKQIRVTLVDELYNALVNDKLLVLNFIYGEKTKDDEGKEKFVPIDGQQRLTTLFLLHWYVFSRSENYKVNVEVLKQFSYQTRNSTKRFCQKLCEADFDFSASNIEEQIKDCAWFTRSFEYDPSIASMLEMINCIHSTFGSVNSTDYLAEKLLSSECPVCFLWLPMDDFKKTDDLFIKMNSRGKLLTDLEIFKAKLQNSQLIEDILGQDASEDERVKYISKYNNLYAEFFYKVFGDSFDKALMAFVKEVIKNDYFCYLVHNGYKQGEYRDLYSEIDSSMNGNVFFKFIEDNGFSISKNEKLNELFAESLVKIDRILEIFCATDSITVPMSTGKQYYSEEQLLREIIASSDTMENNVKRYAIFAFIDKFGLPNGEEQIAAYSAWMRIIHNLVENSPLRGHVEYICQSIEYFNSVIGKIDSYTENSVFTAFSEYENKLTTGMESQIKEEREKIELLRKSSLWEKVIYEAENYYKDGQIGFLLLMAKDEDYSIERFSLFYEKSKQLFDSDKNIKDGIENQFRKAMLCMNDNTEMKTSFLERQKVSLNAWGFYAVSYKGLLSKAFGGQEDQEKVRILQRLLEMIDVNSERDLADQMTDIVLARNESVFDGEGFWKRYFVDYDIFGIALEDYTFSNRLSISNAKKYVWLLTKTTEKSYSMDLFTFVLYKDLTDMGITGIHMNLFATTNEFDAENYPCRYIEYKGIKISYDINTGDGETFLVKNSDQVNAYSRMKVIEMVKNL